MLKNPLLLLPNQWLRPTMVVVVAVGLSALAWAIYGPVKAWATHVLLLNAWDRVASEDTKTGAWGWVDSNPVARLSIDRLNASNIVTSSAKQPPSGPGLVHMQGTAMPGGRGHSVVRVREESDFVGLSGASVGDLVKVERPAGAKVFYRVVRLRFIDVGKDKVRLNPQRDLLTLIADFPIHKRAPDNRQRLIVTAESRF